jgi:hypothetical protein
MIYFACGSNMDWKHMKERCPSATLVGVQLPDHRLAFDAIVTDGVRYRMHDGALGFGPLAHANFARLKESAADPSACMQRP